MKKSDIAVIVLIVSLSVGGAFFVANLLIGSPSSKTEKVRTAEVITGDVTQPDDSIFNKEAINPTVEVEIGGN